MGSGHGLRLGLSPSHIHGLTYTKILAHVNDHVRRFYSNLYMCMYRKMKEECTLLKAVVCMSVYTEHIWQTLLMNSIHFADALSFTLTNFVYFASYRNLFLPLPGEYWVILGDNNFPVHQILCFNKYKVAATTIVRVF